MLLAVVKPCAIGYGWWSKSGDIINIDAQNDAYQHEYANGNTQSFQQLPDYTHGAKINPIP